MEKDRIREVLGKNLDGTHKEFEAAENELLDLFNGVSQKEQINLTEEIILKEAKSRQIDGVEPYSWAGGARWACTFFKKS